MTTPAIRATGLHKRFRATDGAEVVAVERVDLTIQPGEIVAFLGPNGAGKTTTVDMLLGLTSPTAGQVEIVGMTPRQAVEAGRVSAVMQTGGLLPDFTVGETVEAIAALHGRIDRVKEVIDRTGLTVVRGRKVQACSGGEQQRLCFALALIVKTFGRPGYVRRALDAGAAPRAPSPTTCPPRSARPVPRPAPKRPGSRRPTAGCDPSVVDGEDGGQSGQSGPAGC
jgi:ABC-type lipopolysaccharide export system ATPase subunit